MIIVLLALSLGIDAFAVSVCSGMSPGFRRRHVFWLGLYFGGFQAGMALLGVFAGEHLSEHIGIVGPVIAFLLLAVIGGQMVWSALTGKGETECVLELSHKRMIVLAVATSIDALAAGFNLVFWGVNILLACIVIGLAAAMLSLLGSLFGERVGNRFRTRAELVGGLVLIALGIYSLFS